MVIFHSYVKLPEGNYRWVKLPSGKLTVCNGKWPTEIVDLPIKNDDFP